MRRWLKQHVPGRVWSNLATISILGALAALAYGFYSLQGSRLESCRRTYHSFPEMLKPFFPRDRATWTTKQTNDWNKLQRRASELAAQCSRQIRTF